VARPPQPGQSQSYGAANQNEILRQGGLQGQFGGPASGPTMVYMGKDYEKPDRSVKTTKQYQWQRGRTPQDAARSASLPIDVAVAEFWNFDPLQRQRWAELVQRKKGYRNLPSLSDQFYEWRSSQEMAALISSSRGVPTSAFDYMSEAAAWDEANRQRSGGRGGGYSGPVTVTDYQETVNLSNPTEARAFLDNALGQYLGRAPTPKEYKTFTTALNAAQEAAPQIDQSVTTTTPGTATQSRVSNVRREGGIDPGQYTTEWARSQEGVAETQAGTTLLRAFLEMF
jgi:hypothetical protein